MDAERYRVLFAHLVAWRTFTETQIGLRRVARDDAARERRLAGLLYALERRERKAFSPEAQERTPPQTFGSTRFASPSAISDDKLHLGCMTPPTPPLPETAVIGRGCSAASTDGAAQLRIDPASAELRQRNFRRQLDDAHSCAVESPIACACNNREAAPTPPCVTATAVTSRSPVASNSTDRSAGDVLRITDGLRLDSCENSCPALLFAATRSLPVDAPSRPLLDARLATNDALEKDAPRKLGPPMMPEPVSPSATAAAPSLLVARTVEHSLASPTFSLTTSGITAARGRQMSHIDEVLRRHGRQSRERAGAVCATDGTARSSAAARMGDRPGNAGDPCGRSVAPRSPHTIAVSGPSHKDMVGPCTLDRRAFALAPPTTKVLAESKPVSSPPRTQRSEKSSRPPGGASRSSASRTGDPEVLAPKPAPRVSLPSAAQGAGNARPAVTRQIEGHGAGCRGHARPTAPVGATDDLPTSAAPTAAPHSARQANAAAAIALEAQGASGSLGMRLGLRAQEGRVRRQLLAERYRDAQLAAEAARAAKEAEAEIQREWERRERAARVREQREAEERAAKRRAVTRARLELAAMHARRALLQRCGWRPWRTLLARKMGAEQRAAAHWQNGLCSAAIGGWGMLVARRRARRGCEAGLHCMLALRLCARVRLRLVLRRLQAGTARQAALVTAARGVVRAQWMRRLLGAWAKQAVTGRELRAAELLRREMQFGARRKRQRLQRCVRGWVEMVLEARIERSAAAYRKQLLSKVDGWLREMDAAGH